MTRLGDNNQLTRLVYISTLSAGFAHSDLKNQIEPWAISNEQRGITGVLALDGYRVCQILEGPHSAVQDLYATIKDDPRHDGVTELANDPISARHFGQWGMVRQQMIDIVTLAFSI